jgi:hypothetical protein
MNRNEQLEAIKRELGRQDEATARAKEILNRLGADVQICVPRDALETLATTDVHTVPVNGVRG